MNIFDTLISAAELQRLIRNASGNADTLVILDCRAQLGDPEAGPRAWAEGHLPGALHANLETQLAAPAHSVGLAGGGRHPLPDRAALVEQCANWGIGDNTQVVAYDDAGGAYAARAWWLLRWLGHPATAVLNGGIQAWQKRPNAELTTSTATRLKASFTERAPLTKVASLSEVEDAVQTLRTASTRTSDELTPVLLDARTLPRFNGEMEPIDPVAGHIPGAQCFTHSDNLDDNGEFLDPAALAKRFGSIAERATANSGGTPPEVICYCGSGVTAAHNVLAMRVAGLEEPKLYVGSWSEWCADERRPREPAR